MNLVLNLACNSNILFIILFYKPDYLTKYYFGKKNLTTLHTKIHSIKKVRLKNGIEISFYYRGNKGLLIYSLNR